MGAQHELHDRGGRVMKGDSGTSLGPAGGAAFGLVVDSQVDLNVGGFMIETLLQPADCLFLFVDYQAGLAFGVESIARQAILNNAISLARTAMVFNAPIVASTSASEVYSGPPLPSLQAVMPSIERRNMNAWEDDKVRAA